MSFSPPDLLECLHFSNPLCLVCGRDSDGQHFGIQTCRACAMFYRRSLTQKAPFQCKKHSKYCDVQVAEHRLMCKSCRLKKCHQVGMNKEKRKSSFQSAETEQEDLKKMNKTVEMQYLQRVEYCIWHPVTKNPVKWIDIGPIIRRSKTILEEFAPPTSSDFQSLNALQKMTISMKKLRSGQLFSPKIVKCMHFDDYFAHWENMMTRCSEWLMYSDVFRELPDYEKLQFFKIVWAVWRRFERNSMSARVFGKGCLEEKILLISDDVAMRLDDFHLDVSEICGTGMDEYKVLMRKHIMQYFDTVVRTCLQWNFSEEEINFGLCQILWIYASRKLLGPTLQSADSFLSEISENLHEYYKKERRLKNYALRLQVLMDMVNSVLKIQLEHEKTMEMAFLFDMFSIVVSDPKFFTV